MKRLMSKSITEIKRMCIFSHSSFLPLVYTYPSLFDSETLSKEKGTLNCKRDLSLKKGEKRIKKK